MNIYMDLLHILSLLTIKTMNNWDIVGISSYLDSAINLCLMHNSFSSDFLLYNNEQLYERNIDQLTNCPYALCNTTQDLTNKMSCAPTERYVSQDHTGLVCIMFGNMVSGLPCCVCEEEMCVSKHCQLLLLQGISCLLHCEWMNVCETLK